VHALAQSLELSPELRTGRRAIVGLDGVTLLSDLEWHRGLRKWVLHCRLTPKLTTGPFVPATTDWYVLVSLAYPWGSITFYPAKRDGLVRTFPHQRFNAPGRDELPWRTGSLCLDTPARALGRHGYSIEPFGTEERLRWHFRRAFSWLIAASRGELALPSEPFELPQYPTDLDSPFSAVFSESPESFATWLGTDEEFGLVDFYVLRREINLQVIRAFRTLKGKPILMPAWGRSVIEGSGTLSHGFWLRLRDTLVLEPWQAPATWGELRDACGAQGVDLDERLRAAVESVGKKDKMGQVALLGFPIPALIGEAPERMHWLALRLPQLAGAHTQVRGFRKSKQWSRKHNREHLLRDSAPVRWVNSENWYPDQLQTRGRLHVNVTSKKTLVLGAGALGSPMAELLVRAGVLGMMLADGDLFEAGNLARHTLGLEDLNKFKAESVAKRLNSLSPFARVEWFNSDFPPSDVGGVARMNECEVVIDCSGNDELLYELSTFEWKGSRTFFSASLSLGARRLYCFSASGLTFPHDEFRRLITPWLKRDVEENSHAELPREGVGCWHPVFPARADDVWLLASAAVKQFEQTSLSPSAASRLVVFEQVVDDDGMFSGVRRIASEGA
jgi:ThiF family